LALKDRERLIEEKDKLTEEKDDITIEIKKQANMLRGHLVNI